MLKIPIDIDIRTGRQVDRQGESQVGRELVGGRKEGRVVVEISA